MQGGLISHESEDRLLLKAANDALAPYEADVWERKIGNPEAVRQGLFISVGINSCDQSGLVRNDIEGGVIIATFWKGRTSIQELTLINLFNINKTCFLEGED
jgi:hypothetical protein